jgi:hypothetical protein
MRTCASMHEVLGPFLLQMRLQAVFAHRRSHALQNTDNFFVHSSPRLLNLWVSQIVRLAHTGPSLRSFRITLNDGKLPAYNMRTQRNKLQ